MCMTEQTFPGDQEREEEKQSAVESQGAGLARREGEWLRWREQLQGRLVAEPAGEQSLEREIAEQKSGAVRDNPGERMRR